MRTRAVATPLWVKAILAIVLIGGPGWWLADRHDRVVNENRLAGIASEIAGREVTVTCPGVLMRWFTVDATETVSGSVDFDGNGTPSDKTRLRERACAELDALAEGRRERAVTCAVRSSSCGTETLEAAWGLDTIVHEAWHLYGIGSEAETECRAMQTMAWAGQQLGLGEPEAQGLARHMWEAGYEMKPDQYRSTECRDGGPWDLRPQDPRWP